MRRRAFLLTTVAIGCRRSRPTEGGARRIVSMAASTTEALFAIGAGPQVVGRSRYCDYPKEAQSLPSVGGYVDPSLEATLGLRPDLVVGARGPIGPGFVRTLEERGIATWFPDTESLAAIEAMIAGLGARTGHATEAAGLLTAMRARRAAVEAALADVPRRRALLLFEKKPISAAGPESFPDEMLRLAGARNVLTEGARYATLSLEKLIALDPDVILDAEMSASPRPFDSTWSAVRAVREGRVVRVAEESVLRPGPRVFDGVATLARAMHPGLKLP